MRRHLGRERPSAPPRLASRLVAPWGTLPPPPPAAAAARAGAGHRRRSAAPRGCLYCSNAGAGEGARSPRSRGAAGAVWSLEENLCNCAAQTAQRCAWIQDCEPVNAARRSCLSKCPSSRRCAAARRSSHRPGSKFKHSFRKLLWSMQCFENWQNSGYRQSSCARPPCRSTLFHLHKQGQSVQAALAAAHFEYAQPTANPPNAPRPPAHLTAE